MQTQISLIFGVLREVRSQNVFPLKKKLVNFVVAKAVKTFCRQIHVQLIFGVSWEVASQIKTFFTERRLETRRRENKKVKGLNEKTWRGDRIIRTHVCPKGYSR